MYCFSVYAPIHTKCYVAPALMHLCAAVLARRCLLMCGILVFAVWRAANCLLLTTKTHGQSCLADTRAAHDCIVTC